MESMGALRRTHTCNDLGLDFLDQEIILMGWVLRRRDHGGVIFIDLRDRWGITQIVLNPQANPEMHKKAESLRSEFVIRVKGKVSARPAGTVNAKIPTGEIELQAEELEILNTCLPMPFELGEKNVGGRTPAPVPVPGLAAQGNDQQSYASPSSD